MMEPKELSLKVAKLLDDRKAIDVTVIDISPKASFADYFVMASPSVTDRWARWSTMSKTCSSRQAYSLKA